MKLYLSILNEPHESWEGPSFLARVSHLLSFSARHSEVANPDLADAIVFLESNRYKSRHDLACFTGTDLLRRYWYKAFTINYSAYPLAFLPGLYVSLPYHLFNARWHRAIPYPFPSPNPILRDHHSTNNSTPLLFSFRGALSHPVRSSLVSVMKDYQDLGPCQIVDRWFNHTESESFDYIEEISSSKFVLCPRGLATSSYRLYEALKLGRVPVIISNDWIPPQGIPWHACSLRISEDRLNEIPTMLNSFMPRWSQMQSTAFDIWNLYLADLSLADTLFDQLETLLWVNRKFSDWQTYIARWQSYAFRQQNGWDLHSRLQRAFAKLSFTT